MRLLKYSLGELLNNRSFCFLFILNLTFGLTGFIALDGFKVSLDQTIKGRSKAVLGGDFGVSARRPFNSKEIKTIEEGLSANFKATSMIEMFSMVANKTGRSRLVQIKGIEENYPFYGDIILENHGTVNDQAQQDLKGQPVVWVYPELIRQLGVKVGDELFIGSQKFVVKDVVSEDAAAGISTNMAPRIYMNKKYLSSTELLKKGSIAWHSIIYQLPGQKSEALSQFRDSIFTQLDAPEIRVYTHENVSAQMTTLISRLNDFLGLSSLVALFLAGVGTAFLFRSYFRARIKQVAVLISLGTTRMQAFGYYLIQISVLGFLSASFAGLLSFLLVPGLGGLTRDLLPFDIQFVLQGSTIVLGLVVGGIGSLVICLPILLGLKDLKPAILFVDEQSGKASWSWLSFVGVLPSLALFLGLAIWLSNSYQVGVLFTGLFIVSGLLLGGLALWFFSQLQNSLPTRNLSLKWALRDLARNRLTTLSCFVTIGLGALLLNLIPQVQKSLDAELERPEQSKLPSLFMFDIQEEQRTEFEKVLREQGIDVDQISPMIRARLISVNDQKFDKGKGLSESFSREEEREMRFRNRGFNLSYREKLSENETIVEGRDFSGVFDEEKDEVAEISVEKRFAGRLNLKVGDVLKFNIESIPIVGKIVNLRAVKWTSFRPNFFVQFQPGVLEIAPKTFVATAPNLSMERTHQLQDALVAKLPNISMVDVSRIVKRISSIIEQMSWALVFMSFLCLFAGFVVIYSIASHQAQSRSWEVGLLKSLGASFSTIQGQFQWQFAILSFLALSFGSLFSLVISYFISSILFDSLWVFAWKVPLLSVVMGTVITLLVTHLATRRALNRPTKDLL